MSGRVVDHVMATSAFRGSTLLVALVIASHAHDDGAGSWPSVATIAREARVDRRTVYRALQELEASGEVIVTAGGGRGRTNRYRIAGVPRPQPRPQPIHQLALGLGETVTSATETVTSVHANGDTRVTRTVLEPSGTVLARARERRGQPADGGQLRRGQLRPVGDVLRDALAASQRQARRGARRERESG